MLAPTGTTRGKQFQHTSLTIADWIKLSLSNNYTSSINSKTKQVDESARAFVKAILKAAQESIPRGARKTIYHTRLERYRNLIMKSHEQGN